MKKIIAILLALSLVLAFAACGKKDEPVSTASDIPAPADKTDTVIEPVADPDPEPEVEDEPEAVTVMSHADYVAAEIDSEVVIETYVQATQSWWDNQITVYGQSEDGAYFMYNMACPEADAAKLVPGTKIRVTGYKSEWSGEVEIVDASFEILDGSFIAKPVDVTELLGSDALIEHQNEKVLFTDMTVDSIQFKNDEPGDDIYVNLSKGDVACSFCVEFYLTGTETEVYKAVSDLQPGDTVDVEGFLYWYEGANTHITAVTVK